MDIMIIYLFMYGATMTPCSVRTSQRIASINFLPSETQRNLENSNLLFEEKIPYFLSFIYVRRVCCCPYQLS